MNKKYERKFTLNDPEVQAIFDGAFRSSPKSYYRIIDGKHKKALLKTELLNLCMSTDNASRLLQEYQFPTGEFVYNLKRDADLTADQILARREKTAQKAIAKALEAEAEAIMRTKTLKERTAPDEDTGEESQSMEIDGEEDSKEAKALAAEEQRDSKRYQLTTNSSGYFGVYDSVTGGTRLTGRTRQSALEEIALMKRHRDIGFDWPSIMRVSTE